ncbi:MAG: PAS domain S-box protein, partial [Thermoleophilaceae bacterium]|nr:PAS domain S-box protein [Thermoleophilaceae bacterium]
MTVDIAALRKEFPQSDALSAAVDSMPYPFVYYVARRDDEGMIAELQLVYANTVAQGMAQFGSIGETLQIGTVRGHQRALFDAYCAVVESGVSWRGDVLLDEEVLGDEIVAHAFDVSTAKVGDGVAAIWFDITDRVATQEALRESESRLSMLVRALPMVVMAQDLDLKFSWTSELGYGDRVDDVLGKSDFDLLPPQHAEHIVAIKRQVIATGVAARYEVRAPVGGRELIFDTIAEPIRDAANEIVGVLLVLNDVTAQREADRTRAWADATVQTVDVALMAVDKDWMIRSWNHGAEVLFGYRHAEAVGQPVTLLTSSSEPGPFTTAIEDVLNGQHEIFGESSSLRHKNG